MENNTSHSQTKMQMNVSPEADAEFMRLLESEDSERYERLMKNIRRDSPVLKMDEDQALTNFQLGLPTGQHRFVVVGKGAYISPLRSEADRLLQEGTIDEYVKTLLAFVNEPETEPDAPTPSNPVVERISSRKKRADAKFSTAAEKQRAYRERQSSTTR